MKISIDDYGFKTYMCSTCNKNFYYDYGYDGSINHDNETNDHNMKVFVNRFNGSFYDTKYKAFLEAITLDDNLCNLKDRHIDIMIDIFNCKTLWLRKNNYNDIADYLESNRKNIKKEFNRIKMCFIKEKGEEIKELRKDLI